MNDPDIETYMEHPATPVMAGGKAGAVAVSDLKKQYSKKNVHREAYVHHNSRAFNQNQSKTIDPTPHDTYEF